MRACVRRHRSQSRGRCELSRAGEERARGHRRWQTRLSSRRDGGGDGSDGASPPRLRTRSCCRLPRARDRGDSGGRRIRRTRMRRRRR